MRLCRCVAATTDETGVIEVRGRTLSSASPGWPAVLVDGDVTLRPLRLRDAPDWCEARRRNVDWLREWEATPPGGRAFVPTTASTFVAMTRRLRRDARQGRALPFAVL